MKFINPNNNAKSFYRGLPSARYGAPTGFIENWNAALNNTINEDTSLGQMIYNKEMFGPRNKRLHDYIEDGTLDNEEVSQFYTSSFEGHKGRLNYTALADYARNKRGLKEIETDEELWKRVRDDINVQKSYAQDIFSRSEGAGGVIGKFAGSAHAIALDPVLLPSWFIGVGPAGHGAKFLATFGKAALRIGTAEAGLETLNQYNIYQWRKDIHSDYSVRDAMNNIFLAGVAGGSIGGMAGGIGDLVRRYKLNTPAGREARQSLEYLQRELLDAPDQTADPVKYIEGVEGEYKRLNELGPAGDEMLDEAPSPIDDADLDRQFDEVVEVDPEGNASVFEYDETTKEMVVVEKNARQAVDEMDEADAQLTAYLQCKFGG